MRVLVTGAAGFVGSRVARVLLRDGCEVHGWIRGDPRGRLDEIRSDLHLVTLDLRDREAIGPRIADIRPDLCIHCAWHAVPGEYLHSPANQAHVEIGLTLARSLAEAGCEHLVGVGTCFEYDTALGILSEASPTGPSTVYAQSKLALQRALVPLCAEAGLGFGWARLFYLFGPFEDERRLVPSVIQSLLETRPARTTAGEQVRDFLHVDDVAEALWAIARHRLEGPVNVGSGQGVTVRDVVLGIGGLLGRPELIELGALPYPAGDPVAVQADNRRLVEECSWAPSMTLEQGLRATIDWWTNRVHP